MPIYMSNKIEHFLPINDTIVRSHITQFFLSLSKNVVCSVKKNKDLSAFLANLHLLLVEMRKGCWILLAIHLVASKT